MLLELRLNLDAFGRILFMIINLLLIQLILKNGPFIKLTEKLHLFLFNQFNFFCQQQALSSAAAIGTNQSSSTEFNPAIPAIDQHQYIIQLIAFNGGQNRTSRST